MVAVFITPMSAAALISWWVSSQRGWWLLLLGPTEFISFWFLGSLIMISCFAPLDPPWQWLIVLPSIVLLACVAAAMIVWIRYHNVNPSFLLEFSAGVAISGFLLIFCLLVGGSILNNILQYAGQGAQPEAVLFVDLVDLVTIAVEWERLPRQLEEVKDSKQEELIEKLEEVAKRAERAFPRLVSRSNSRLRERAADRGRQVAAVIRKHEERVLEVSSAQRILITASLVNGVVYLLRRDWDSLLVVEPERGLQQGVQRLVRRYAPRVALAMLLIALAFLLPALLPSLITDPLSFQATVFVTAGFTIIAPDVQKAADAVKSFSK